jgi:hypothetical protein
VQAVPRTRQLTRALSVCADVKACVGHADARSDPVALHARRVHAQSGEGNTGVGWADRAGHVGGEELDRLRGEGGVALTSDGRSAG